MANGFTPQGQTRRAHVPARAGRRAAPRRVRSRVVFVILGVAFTSLLAALVTFAHFFAAYTKLIDERLASGYLTSRAGFYAAPRVLRAGQALPREQLITSLRCAGYVEAADGASNAGEVWSGQFDAAGPDGSLLIRQRRGADSSGSREEVRVEFDGRGRIASLTSAEGAPLESFALAPEPLTHDPREKSGARETLAFADLPENLVRAVLAAEDRRFFEHHGLDVFGVARALSRATFGGGETSAPRQGGSTVTQQLVKNTYLTHERTLRRKLREAVFALALERRLSKQEIFALYCREIYLGQRGGLALRGVKQAARAYFGKDLTDLSLAEAATLAGMIRAPALYAPDRHPQRARLRRDAVLASMREADFISRDEHDAALRAPLAVAAPPAFDGSLAPYFVDYAERIAAAQPKSNGHGPAENSRAGAGDARVVHTTIDLELQRLAESSVRRQLDALDRRFKDGRRPQAALVALDARTGAVLALVGGRDYRGSQLNRATDAARQPGSVFKPFVYAAALEAGVSPAVLFADAPRTFSYDEGRSAYRPSNYGGAYSMRDVTMREALVRSLNTVTVEVALRVGLGRVADTAEGFGLPRPNTIYPSLALGTAEATPLEVAAAYASLANGGTPVRPFVTTARGGRVEQNSFEYNGADEARQLVKPSTAYAVTDMLSAVVERGTARAARGALKGLTAAAGKTGTSRDD